MKNKLIPATRIPKEPKVRKPKKQSPRCCPEPSAEQLQAATDIVAGIPPAAALAAVGVTSAPSTVLKGGAMRTALRLAIEKALEEQGRLPDIDKMAAGVLVGGLDATRPVVLGKNEIHDYPDHPTRGAFLDRLLKLTGDMSKAAETDAGDTWDSLVLRMRRTPVLGA